MKLTADQLLRVERLQSKLRELALLQDLHTTRLQMCDVVRRQAAAGFEALCKEIGLDASRDFEVSEDGDVRYAPSPGGVSEAEAS